MANICSGFSILHRMECGFARQTGLSRNGMRKNKKLNDNPNQCLVATLLPIDRRRPHEHSLYPVWINPCQEIN